MNLDELPEKCEPLREEINGLVGQVENESQLELVRGIIAQMVEDAMEMAGIRLAGKKTISHLIEAWRKKRYKELGYPAPAKQEPEEPQPPAPHEEGGILPVEPQGTEPDAALLADDGPDMEKFKPVEVTKTARRRGRPPKHPED